MLIAGMIFLASSRSRVAAPDLHILPVDKVAHFGIYGLLGTLLCRTGRDWRAGMWAVLGASVFGVSDEFHQSFVPGRSVDVLDWAADTLGAALAVSLYWGWGGYRRLMERPLLRRAKAVGELPTAT